MSESESEQYKLRWRGRESGPYPLGEINRMLDDHEIGMGHEILYGEKWMGLEEFFAATAKPPPEPAAPVESVRGPVVTVLPLEKTGGMRFKVSVKPVAGRPEPEAVATVSSRKRMVFAFLAIFLGFLGVHNFYARQWLTGLLQLLLSVATSLMGFGIIASWLWAMVEAVVVRKDGDGAEMT
ncbi:MAG TPA: TM2 domain-containing protein [Verrucomicrobiae bacterium]|nr:TM2 domain-containing protein [Verrucomicrobiae bacterium]